MEIQQWMVDQANKQIRKPIRLNINSQAKAKRVYAEREYVMRKIPIEVSKDFALLLAKETEEHLIASPDLGMEERGEEQLFFINLRSIALCNSLDMGFEPVTSLFLITTLNNDDLKYDEFTRNMS